MSDEERQDPSSEPSHPEPHDEPSHPEGGSERHDRNAEAERDLHAREGYGDVSKALLGDDQPPQYPDDSDDR